jgi:uncharacterized radical SAM superfamily Fe-S cluster-containing enzyme
MKKWLCPLPFVHTAMRPGGLYGTCCESKKSSISIHEQTPIEFFNSEYSQNLRKAFLTDHPEEELLIQEVCGICLDSEKNFGASKRTRELEERGDEGWNNLILEKNYNIVKEDFTQYLEPSMQFFKIAVGNTCNLKCIMCNPRSSSLIGGYVYDPDFSDDFYDDLNKILPSCQVLQFSGGEPTLLKNSCLKVIQWCIDMGHSHLEIHFNTNGTAPVSKFEKYLPYFRQVSLNVSIDAYGERDEYIRENTKWGSKEKHLLDYILLMHDVGRGKFRVGINPTIQSLNVGYLGELHDYGQQLNIEVCPENIVKSPPRYNPLNLPTKIKKYYIEKLKQYKFSTVNGVLESPEGDHQMFKALLDKLKNMDKSRGTNFLNLWPEFEEYC